MHVPCTGVNNNAYQISRALYHNSRTGRNINDLSQFVKADFMSMPFEDNSFDAVYQIDATCHAPDQVGCYKVMIMRCLQAQLLCAGGQALILHSWLQQVVQWWQ